MSKQIRCPGCDAMLDVDSEVGNPFTQCGRCGVVFERQSKESADRSANALNIQSDYFPRGSEPEIQADVVAVLPELNRRRIVPSGNLLFLIGAAIAVCVSAAVVSGPRTIQTALRDSRVPPPTPLMPSAVPLPPGVTWADYGVTITHDGPERVERMVFEAGVDPIHGLAMLRHAPQVQQIDLSGTKLVDQHLALLEKTMPYLRKLNLSNTEITDAGTQRLATLWRLESLQLRDCQITDASLVVISRLPLLQELGLSGTQVTDAGLEFVGKLTRLENLYLGDTKVTDAGLAHLRNFSTLRTVNLRNTEIGDRGVAALTPHQDLSYLHLAGTQVSDHCVSSLRQFTALEAVNVFETQFTDAGVDQLETALPSLVVVYNNP